MLQWTYPTFDLVIRVADEPAATADRVRAALATSTMFQRPAVRTMESIRDDAVAVSRVGGYALSACAGIALLLAAIGLYGLVAMWATARRGEIGIRLALGASSRHVHVLLLSGVARIAGTGAAIGLICAFGLVQVERGWMGPIVRLDTLVILASLVTLGAIAGLAVLLPSLKATRLPPADVLRSIG
jgi:ABC-type antimicrobial peptide transport system permease subunit